MKKILCFGDSNTFGFNPNTGLRFDKDTRWSGILSNLCSSQAEITEAGMNNRTAFSNNPLGKKLTGYKIIQDYLKQDFDYIILQIGINDLHITYNPTYEEFEKGLSDFVRLVKVRQPNAKIILLIPSVIKQKVLKGYFRLMFDKNSIEKSKFLPEIYKKVADYFYCEIIDLNKVAEVSDIDGIHYEAKEHLKIALAVKDILSCCENT